MNPHARLLVGWSVGWMVSRYVIFSYKKQGNLHFHASIGAPVCNRIYIITLCCRSSKALRLVIYVRNETACQTFSLRFKLCQVVPTTRVPNSLPDP